MTGLNQIFEFRSEFPTSGRNLPSILIRLPFPKKNNQSGSKVALTYIKSLFYFEAKFLQSSEKGLAVKNR